MSTVRTMERLLKRVGKVLTISADAPTITAARRMTDNEVGCLIVLDGPEIVGICSERDVIQAMASGSADAVTAPVRDVMTREVISCTPQTPVAHARRMMAAHGIRHLPVIMDGVAVGMVSSRDVLAYRLYETNTMLAEAKRNVRAADQAKSEFLSNVGHEVRTPMASIIGMTELVLGTPLTAEQRDCLTMVKESAHSLLAILTNILSFSEVSAGKLTLDEADFDLRAVLDERIQACQDFADAKDLELSCAVAPDVPGELVGDAERLGQVLNHLIRNGIKFTNSGQVGVRVETESRDDGAVCLHFAVRDTGVGIRKGAEKLIFQAFKTGDESYNRPFDGAGLGLAVCSRLVGLMGGRIWADSEFGSGSTFHFTARFGLQANAVGQAV